MLSFYKVCWCCTIHGRGAGESAEVGKLVNKVIVVLCSVLAEKGEVKDRGSREVSVNLFPEAETGRQTSRGEPTRFGQRIFVEGSRMALRRERERSLRKEYRGCLHPVLD